MATELGITKENSRFPHPKDPNRILIWLYDFVHIYKNIRNHLLDDVVQLPCGKIVCSDDFWDLLEVGEAGRQSAIGELSSPLFPDNDSIDGGCEEEREMKGREAKLAVCDCVTAAGRRRNAAALFFLVDCLVDCLEHWNDTKALQ